MSEYDPKQPPSHPPKAAVADDAADKADRNSTQPAAAHGGSATAHVEAPAEQPDATAATATATGPRGRRLAAGILIAVLIVLASGEAWLFKAQGGMPDQATQVANLTDQVNTLRGRFDALGSKVDVLSSKLGTLDARVASQATAQTKTPASPPPTTQVSADLAGRITKIESDLASLSTTALADHAAITKLQQQGGDLPKLAAKAKQLAAVAQASLNLQNGLKLGSIPDAPPTLTRYTDTAPPTLASLKESFSRYADAAASAAGNTTKQGGFWQKVKGRVESLVTLRHKDAVLVGSSAAGTLGKAQIALDRDDLAGALAALKALPPVATATMKPWIDKANNLLAARAALAKMAEQG